MVESYRAFGSCVLFKEILADDLGHLYRAGTVVDGAVDRVVWLRVLDAAGLPAPLIVDAFDAAKLVAAEIQSAHLPSDPLHLEVGGVPVLGCDYVPGQPLNRVLTRARDEAFPMQPDNALLIAEKIALALSAGLAYELDGRSLTHGFLHPGLIFLSNDGEALVTGFGLGEALLEALEEPDAIAGVRAYLAPEVLSNRSPSKQGDVYSLGAILFHLLTGTALPAAPDERAAAIDAACLADTGEALPADIRSLLLRALAADASSRFSSVAELRSELDQMVYGGDYSPTTFNLALFMDRLFRAEADADDADLARELESGAAVLLASPDEPLPEAVPEIERSGPNRGLWAVAAGAVAVAVVVAAVWWAGGFGEPSPPPTPTPTAAEIAARRQAQEDRLTSLTQQIVQQMMAEREEEIRQELVARQQRIEELQLRLQESERRAARGAAAKKEAEIQQALKRELAEQEQAQREQEEALEAERQQSLEPASTAEKTAADGVAAAGAGEQAHAGVAASAGVTAVPTAVKPTPAPARPTATAPTPRVKPGELVLPEQVDARPVVIKAQPLVWPRSALRSLHQGVVVVQVTVNETGGVDDVKVLRADHTGFGIPEAAVEAASGYRFKPGTKDGVAITTHAFITWRYDFSEP